MPRTAPSRNTIALVFDFDDTLAPDSTSSLLQSLGLDVEAFWSRAVQPLLDEGWDPMTALFYCLLVGGRPATPEAGAITRDKLAEVGRALRPFEGVPALFERLRRRVQEISAELRLEFHLVSCGIAEIIRNTSIFDEFTTAVANELHFDERGRALFPRVIISHTEKTRYLYQIAKGLEEVKGVRRPFAVSRHIPREQLRIPIDQFIYVGDGLTDVPCFSVVYQYDGVAIGVRKQETRVKWGESSEQDGEERVTTLARVDYREGSALVEALEWALTSVCYRLLLRAREVPGR